MNLNIIPTIECTEVSKPISSSRHSNPPYQLQYFSCCTKCFDYYEERLHGMGIKIIQGETELGKDYPEDIAYNVGRIETCNT